jgi:ABC-type dipeptide/oligopeptide/nickel transport system permease subunit
LGLADLAPTIGRIRWIIFRDHLLLPNLIGPIIVYATLIVPSAILK